MLIEMTEKEIIAFKYSLKDYVVTNGICELTIKDIYNTVCKNVYWGIFANIMNSIRNLLAAETFKPGSKKIKYYLPDEIYTNETIHDMSKIESIAEYFKLSQISYSFKYNAHHIEIKNFPCDIIFPGKLLGYNKRFIRMTKMIVNCSFSFRDSHNPYCFTYSIDHLETEEYYKNIKNFKSFSLVLFQPEFQEDISDLMTSDIIPHRKIINNKDAFVKFKYIDKLAETVSRGLCDYVVSPVKTLEDKLKIRAEVNEFKIIIDAILNDNNILHKLVDITGLKFQTIKSKLKNTYLNDISKTYLCTEEPISPQIDNLHNEYIYDRPEKESEALSNTKTDILKITGDKLF